MKISNVLLALTTAGLFMLGLTTLAHAQENAPGEGVLAPPPEISNIISIDAHNYVLVETQDPQQPNAPREYSLAIPKHIYSGGVARVFGGTVIPTEMLVIPQSAMRGGMMNPTGVTSFGGGNFGSGGNVGFGNALGGGFPGGVDNGFNTGFGRMTPTIPVNNMRQFNQVLGYIDQPMRQVQVGTGFSNTTTTENDGFGFSIR